VNVKIYYRLVFVFSISLILASCAQLEGEYYKMKSCIRELNQVPVASDIDYYPLKGEFVDVRSKEGQKRLFESQKYNDYPQLAAAYLTQSTQTFCGIASSVMVLNADKSLLKWGPKTSPYKPFHFYTQCNILNKHIYQYMSVKKILNEGMQLNEIHQVLSKQPSVKNVSCTHATNVNRGVADTIDLMPHECSYKDDLAHFTQNAKRALKTEGQYLIANFAGMPNKERGGHFSPIAAYHSATDSFLVMDVSRYKFPPYWVTRQTLWKKMQTVDSGSGKSRGYIVVETKLNDVY
jgi:hypothetical protein